MGAAGRFPWDSQTTKTFLMRRKLLAFLAIALLGMTVTACSPSLHKKPAPAGQNMGTTKPAERANQ